jgi:hypothetical protein
MSRVQTRRLSKAMNQLDLTCKVLPRRRRAIHPRRTWRRDGAKPPRRQYQAKNYLPTFGGGHDFSLTVDSKNRMKLTCSLSSYYTTTNGLTNYNLCSNGQFVDSVETWVHVRNTVDGIFDGASEVASAEEMSTVSVLVGIEPRKRMWQKCYIYVLPPPRRELPPAPRGVALLPRPRRPVPVVAPPRRYPPDGVVLRPCLALSRVLLPSLVLLLYSSLSPPHPRRLFVTLHVIRDALRPLRRRCELIIKHRNSLFSRKKNIFEIGSSGWGCALIWAWFIYCSCCGV